MDWPINFLPYRWEFYLEPNTRTFISPLTRTRQVLEGQAPRWRGTGSFRFKTKTTADRRKAQRFEAFLDSLKGQVETVKVWDFAVCGGRPLGPNLDLSSIGITKFTDGTGFSDGDSPPGITYFSGGAAGVTVYGGWSVGSAQVLLTGYPQHTTQLYAGDQVELGGFLYRLTADATADGLNRAYLALNRPLVAAIAHGDAVVFTRPRTPMQLIDDQQARRTVEISGVREYTVSMIECFF